MNETNKAFHRAQAKALEDRSPYYDARAAGKLSIGAGLVAGVIVYLVNGQDLVRAGLAAAFWIAIGWYSGKAIFPRDSVARPPQQRF